MSADCVRAPQTDARLRYKVHSEKRMPTVETLDMRELSSLLDVPKMIEVCTESGMWIASQGKGFRNHQLTPTGGGKLEACGVLPVVRALSKKLLQTHPSHTLQVPHIWASKTPKGSGFPWHTDAEPWFLMEGALHGWMNLTTGPGCNHGLHVAEGGKGSSQSGICTTQGFFKMRVNEDGTIAPCNPNEPDVQPVALEWQPMFCNLFPSGSIHRTHCTGEVAEGLRVTLAFRLVPNVLNLSPTNEVRLAAFARMSWQQEADMIALEKTMFSSSSYSSGDWFDIKSALNISRMQQVVMLLTTSARIGLHDDKRRRFISQTRYCIGRSVVMALCVERSIKTTMFTGALLLATYILQAFPSANTFSAKWSK